MVERILDKNMVECSSHSGIIYKEIWLSGWKCLSWVQVNLINYEGSNPPVSVYVNIY